MIACVRLRSTSASICNQRLALMKKLARFVCLSAVSCPQLSFGSRELPINNKDAAQLSGREPAAHAFLFSFLAWMACAKEFSFFMPFDLHYKTLCCWGRGQIIAFFRHGSTCSPALFSRSRSYGLSWSVFHHQCTQVSVWQAQFCCLATHTPARRLTLEQFIKTDAGACSPVTQRVCRFPSCSFPLPSCVFLAISETLQLHWIPYWLCMQQHALLCGTGSSFILVCAHVVLLCLCAPRSGRPLSTCWPRGGGVWLVPQPSSRGQ